MAGPHPDPSPTYQYRSGERVPVEILVFRVDPDDVDEFLRVDHEVWTLGEADSPGVQGVPFLAKEVWLDDSRPGEITVVMHWPSIEAWNAVDQPEFQRQLAAEFDRRFDRPYEIVQDVATSKAQGIHRWSRFEPSTTGES